MGTRQGPSTLQLLGIPGVQTPPEQVSSSVHKLPSEHAVPLCGNDSHSPWMQKSLVHWLPSSQILPGPLTQEPWTHASPSVQLSPSSHGASLPTCKQPLMGSQLSLVHMFWSSHCGPSVLMQMPAWQKSAPVHMEPSALQTPFSFTFLATHLPLTVSQLYFTHSLSPLVSQMTTVPRSNWHV